MRKRATWIIIVIVLIGVVIGAVFFNMFVPRNTEELAQLVYNITETGYLSETNSSNTTFDAYTFKLISSTSQVSSLDKAKITDYRNFYGGCEIAGQFFRRQIVFSKYTKSYSKNLKKIKDNFNKASQNAKQLEAFMANALKASNGQAYWEKESWEHCHKQLEQMMKQTADAMFALIEVYQTCVDSEMLNNNFTKVLFMALQDSIQDIKKLDVTTEGSQFLKLTANYMTTETEKKIIKYNFDTSLQGKIDKILTDANGKNTSEYQQFLNGSIA